MYPWAFAYQQEKPSQQESRVPQLKSSPHPLQLEKARAQQEDPAQSKKVSSFIKKVFKKPMTWS